MRVRLLEFLAGPELGAVATLAFAGLYTWPLLTSDKPSATFYFAFCVWVAHIAFLALTSLAHKQLEALQQGHDSPQLATPSEPLS